VGEATGVELSAVDTRKLLSYDSMNLPQQLYLIKNAPMARPIVRLLRKYFSSDSKANPCSGHSYPIISPGRIENKATQFLATTGSALLRRGRVNSDFASNRSTLCTTLIPLAFVCVVRLDREFRLCPRTEISRLRVGKVEPTHARRAGPHRKTIRISIPRCSPCT